MADLETSFVNHMKATSAITDLVGSRIYEFEPDDGAREPNIFVRAVDNVRGSWTQTKYGGVARISIYVNTESVAQARTIGAAILTLYKQFSGALDSHVVNYVEVSNARALWGPGDEFRYLVDLVVHYKE